MKLIKYFVFLMILIILACGAIWYYSMSNIASEINNKFAGKKHEIKGLSSEDYYTTFSKVLPSGFPFKFQLKILNWKEETKTAVINYNSPIYVGYDLFTQKLFVNYSGEIISEYKPVGQKFGARFEVDKYYINIDLPITSELIKTLKNLVDPFEIVNYFGKIKAGTSQVRIFDLNDNGKFYDKEYERINFSFKPAKYYKSLEDFLANIPTHYNADYSVKTKPVTEPSRRLPVSLLYGFFTYPQDIKITGNIDVATKAKTFDDLAQDLTLEADVKITSPYIDLNSGKVNYVSSKDKSISAFEIDHAMNFGLKKGAFDELFQQYRIIKPSLVESGPGKIINREIEYIIANKEAFRFAELENANYEVNLKALGNQSNSRRFIKINNMSILSDESGLKLNTESTFMKGNLAKRIDERIKAEGVLLIQNYPAVVEFSSGYIYRFGKFRFLNDEARDLYVKVNKKFLKQISDHPDSKSNDLSFEFEFDSSNYSKIKFGSVEFDQIRNLYEIELFKVLVDHVGIEGDFEKRMKKIIPDLDLESPVLNKVLPKLKRLQNPEGKDLKDIISNKLEKNLPEDAKKAIDKIAPDGFKKKINKELWKNMVQ